tara:strand:- start:77 stop:664 length:588 start_codon:yes stop_codon:yes gene_type:complete
MKKILLLGFVLSVFSLGCSEIKSAQKDVLNAKDLTGGIHLLSGFWYQNDDGDKYYFQVSLPFETDIENDKLMVNFILEVIGYESEEIEFRVLGTINLFDRKKGLDEFGDKVEFLKLNYLKKDGKMSVNEKWIHIKTKLRDGTRVLPGYQLKFTRYNNQFGSGMKKYNLDGLYEDYGDIFILNKMRKDGEFLEAIY